MPSKAQAMSSHAQYYLFKLRNIEQLLKQRAIIAQGVEQWELEKDNITAGQRSAQEYTQGSFENREIPVWFAYFEFGLSFLFDIDPHQLIDWELISLKTARSIGTHEKEMDLLDGLALSYKYIGQPNTSLKYLRDELLLARKHDLREKECYVLNEVGDIYKIIGSGGLPVGTLRKFDMAIHYYRSALEIARDINRNNEIGYALKELGHIYFLCSYYQHAGVYFKRALAAARPEDRVIRRECLTRLAEVYMFTGKRALARQHLNEAIGLVDENNRRADIDFATLNNPIIFDLDPGEYEKILIRLLNSYELIPAHQIRVLMLLASLMNVTGRDHESLVYLENVCQLAKNLGNIQHEIQALVFMTRSYLFAGNKPAAAKSKQKLLMLMDENGYARLPMINTIDLMLKWPAPILRSINFFGRYIYKGRKFVTIPLRLRSGYLEWRHRVEQVEEADLNVELDRLSEILRRKPANSKKRLELARLYLKLNKFELALQEIKKVLCLNQNNPQALKIKGDTLVDTKDYAGALQCYSRAISIKPETVEFWLDRGFLHFHHGTLDDALNDFSAAISLKPKYGLYYAHRWMVYSRMGRQVDAEKEFERAVLLKANAYFYIDRASVAALNLDSEGTVQNLRSAFKLIPVSTLKVIKFDPCFTQIKNLVEFQNFLSEITD